MLDKAVFALIIGMQVGTSSNKILIPTVAAAEVAVSSNKIFIPTSAALDVAERVAKGEGYSLADRTKFFFDVMLDKNNKPAFPGFVTVGFYWNSDIVSAISIDEGTGQVLDIDKCVIFDYPSLRRFQKDISQGTGMPALSMEDIGKKVGCESFKRLSVPRKIP